MAITNSSIGPNTVQVSASGTYNTITDLIDAVKTAVIGTSPSRVTGWTCSIDTTTASVRTQFYKSLNADQTTYKWLIARWDLIKMELNTSTCEGANSVTDITNESHTFLDCSPIGFATRACDIIVMVSPRWLAFTSFINNNQSLWAGVFETLRENPNDTAAALFPCWMWTSATLPLLGMTSYTNTTATLGEAGHTFCAFPRTRDGSTGVNAAKDFSVSCGAVTHPSWEGSVYDAPLVAQIGLTTAARNLFTTGWSSSKVVAPIKAVHKITSSGNTPYGLTCGLKMTLMSNLEAMNQISVPVDALGNYSGSGTSNNHWLLNCAYKGAGSTYWMANNSAATTFPVQLGTGSRAMGIASTGDKYYCSSATGLYVVNAATNMVATAVSGASTCDGAVIYDGEKYIYATTSTGVVRVDTTNSDSVVALTCCAGGVAGIAISSASIFCTPRTASTAPICAVITRGASFTTAEKADLTISPAFTESVVLGAVCTYAATGDFLAMPSYVATAANGKVLKIAAADNMVTTWATNVTAAASSAYYQAALYPMDSKSIGVLVYSTSQQVRSGIFAYTNTSTNYTTNASVSIAATNRVAPMAVVKAGGMVSAYNTALGLNLSYFCGSAGGYPSHGSYAGAVALLPLTYGSTDTSVALIYDGASLVYGSSTGITIQGNVNGRNLDVSGSTAGRFCLPS